MSLTGIWTNELRSVMLLIEGADRSLAGFYHSVVGRDLAGELDGLDPGGLARGRGPLTLVRIF